LAAIFTGIALVINFRKEYWATRFIQNIFITLAISPYSSIMAKISLIIYFYPSSTHYLKLGVYMLPQYHIKLKPGDVAPYVLLPGDPKRVPVIAAHWDESELIADNREYVTYTGTYKGVPISCTSTGIGCPSTSIAMEELARVGATTFIRVGTCGTFQDHIQNGDIAIFDSAMRLEGTSHLYAPPEYPAVANYEVINACIEAGDLLNYRYHVGATRSADTFYAGHSRPGSSFNNFWQSNWKNHFMDLKRLNIIAAEMEASTIFVLAKIWGLRAGGISAVLDNVITVTGEDGNFDPESEVDHSKDHIVHLSKMACETVRILHEKDNQN
jgi:uridine phosphorylase